MSSSSNAFPFFWKRLLPQTPAGNHDAPSSSRGDTTATHAGGLSLSIRQLQKSFGSQTVLKQLDLDVDAGQFIAIVGRSGCGKSTLLRALASLESCDAGSLHAGTTGATAPGGPATTTPLQAYTRDIRMMFQDSRLLPWLSVLDNIGLGLRGNWRPQAQAALEEVGLSEHATKWPSQLSGGQRQRVALARALIHRPRLLLLDEPLGALDALTRLEMQALVEKIWQTHAFTVLLVTHEVEEAVALGDRVVLMEAGSIALDLTVPLPRPRSRANPAFISLRETVLERVLRKH